MGILLLAAARGSTNHDLGGRQRRARRRDGAGGAGAIGIRRGCMQRLTGIGVSPGIVAGRAVLLIQRVAGAALPDRAGPRRSRAAAARGQPDPIARSARRHPRAGREAAGRRIASLFDAQLLMLDDPMLVPRAADIVREQRVNAEWAVQQVFARVQRGLRRGRRSVPARAQRRRRRPGRPPAHEPAPGRRHAARAAARARRVVRC